MSNLVAVFQIGSLGDSIVSIPTLLSIRELIPDCAGYILVSKSDSNLKVLPGDVFEMAWKPSVQLTYAGPSRRLLQVVTVPSVLARLRYYKPRCCVSLMPADREPERIERDRKFFRAGGIKELLGFEAFPATRFQPGSDTRVEDTESYQRFERIWKETAREKFEKYTRMPILRPSSEAVLRVEQWLRANRKHPKKRLIAFSPYSNFSSRDIPEATVVGLLPRLADKADAEIVIVGGSKDHDRAAKVTAGTSFALNACGVFSAQESAALMKASSLAVCTESGPMHLASAVGVPLLVTFSRINPQFGRWLPFGQYSTILYRDVPCAGCFSVNCPVAGHPCMNAIAADDILCSALNILSSLPVVESAFSGTRVLTW
jgi:ADP-heptose:LPS heptosyltransferase